MKSLLRNVKRSYGGWKMSERDEEMSNEEGMEFLDKMIESNRERVDYEIDDELFDKCVFDDDGNLLEIKFDNWNINLWNGYKDFNSNWRD